MSEIIFLAILALIVIGPKELPQVARTLGRFLNELKRTTSEFTDDLKQQARIDPIDLYDRHKQAHNGPPANPEVKPEAETADPGDWTSEDHVPHGQAMAAKESNPQQMEFKIQNNSNDDDDKGSKG
ncbi:twin-arginine translocase TatA/TatE family subunit [Bdellovibrio sp. ZAP7]|uniref:Sec-independent protein translocase subunit TatA/TatB n=1 Tax=Bdellovibrio sp. ZAP7 TaxID=2231053 RepID=UPI001FEEA6CE|nr:twin-arginine translocase TatA/TatE family subunit [Bdellovibrio sp. ZAP7]